MTAPALANPAADLTPFEQLSYGREIIRLEAKSLERLSSKLSADFCLAVRLLFECPGCVIVAGIGKAGLVGQKIAATMASTGTRAHFLHPAEALHGDLGRVHADDVVLVLSQSGETEEVVRMLPSLERLLIPIIAITAKRTSALGRAASVTLELGPQQEACSLGLAPSTSTTAMLALGDALALVTSRMRRFGRDDFARFHPGGSLGRKLSKVDELMRPLAECRLADESTSVRQVFAAAQRPDRRCGAIMLLNDRGELSGLFTDSDLARLFEARHDEALDQPIREVMTRRPRRVQTGSMIADAVAILAERKISELPVVDQADRPLGLIDITDVLGLLPDEKP